jgi:hypothetical protein
MIDTGNKNKFSQFAKCLKLYVFCASAFRACNKQKKSMWVSNKSEFHADFKFLSTEVLKFFLIPKLIL